MRAALRILLGEAPNQMELPLHLRGSSQPDEGGQGNVLMELQNITCYGSTIGMPPQQRLGRSELQIESNSFSLSSVKNTPELQRERTI